MKNLVKKYWWIGLIILLGIVVFIQRNKINKLDDVNQLKSVEISTMKDSVLNVVTKNGQLISKVQSVEVEKDNLKESLKIAGFDIKELRKDNIKKNNLILAMKAELEASGSINTPTVDTFKIVNTDTIYYKLVDDWTDGKLSLFNGTIIDKKLNFEHYDFKVGFDFFLTEQKNKSIVTVRFPDESVKLTTANSITVVHKKKWWEKWWLWTAVGITGGVLISK